MRKAILQTLLLPVLLLTGSAVMGQLSGAYTINGALPTGGTNYQTFSAAVTALTTNGVSGAVTFNVASGTYSEQISIHAIAGASSSNTITFKGLGDLTTITASPSSLNRPIISIDSASHITIDSLKIQITGSQGWGVHFMNHADTNEVLNCNIVGPVVANIFGIVASGSISSVTGVQNNAEYILIQNNTITGCDRSIQMVGQTGPLTTPSKQINYGTDIRIIGNTMTNFRSKAVIINHYHNVEVDGNTMSSSSSVCNGAASFWDAGDNLAFTKNNVYVSSNISNTRVVVLSMAPANGPAGDSLLPGIVANNMIQYEGTNSTAPTGLLLKNKAYIKVYNNTFKVKNQGNAANCIWLDNNNARSLNGVEVRNNVMVLENAGSGQFLYTANGTLGARFKNLVLDHNDYFAPNGYFNTRVPNGTGLSTFSSFSNFQANTYGWGTGAMNVDPGFVSLNNLHATSAAMNDSGAVIMSITDDIDGDMRSTTTPDIGADEYTPPTCSASSGLGAFNVYSSSAEVFWSSINSSATYKVQYDTVGFSLGTGVSVLSNTDTLMLSGLQVQTSYEFYVIDICSPTDSSTWAGPFSFTTTCATISTFPYSENFDGSTWSSGSGTNNSGDVKDPCWVATPDGSTASIYRWGTRSGPTGSTGTGPSADASGTGKYVYTESSYSPVGTVAELETPNMDLSVLSVPQLEFKYHMYGSTMGTMHVAIQGAGIEDTLVSLTDNLNSWQDMLISLAGYSGIYKIVFYGVRGTSTSGDMAIDEFKVSESPLCPEPTMISLSNAATNSIDINFTSNGTRFLLEYGPTGFVQGTGGIDTAYATGHTIMGLTSNTTYDIYIQNDCTDSLNGFSTWAGPFTMSTLCSVFSTFPFTETFDGMSWTPGTGSYSTGDAISACWARTPTASTAFRWAVRTGTTVSSNTGPSNDVSGGGNYVYTEASRGSNGHQAFFTSPAFDLSQLSSPQLVFDYHMFGGSMGSMYVEITNGTITDTLVSVTGAQGNQWNNQVVNLGSSYSGIYQFRFIGVRGSSFGSDMAIDQFVIQEAPLCVAPTYLIASNIAVDSLDLNWGGGNGTSWDIEYGFTGYSQGTGTLISGVLDTTETITGLLANTCYDFYVRSNCSPINSAWYGPITACTPCAVEIAPYSEDFDAAPWVSGSGTSNTGDAMSSCWSRNPGPPLYRWSVRTGTTSSTGTGPSSDVSGTGNYMYTEASTGSNGHVAYLTLPTIDFTALTKPALSFKYHMYGAVMGELFVTILNGSNWDTIYSLVGEQHTANTDPFTTAYIDLTAYKTVPREIRIGGKRSTSFSSDMAIDEVSVDEMPSCLLPDAFALDTVTSSYADFSWNSVSGGTNFIIEYGLTGYTQGTGAATKTYHTGLSGNVPGLVANTTYDAYLADECDSSVWVGPITFTTLIDDDAELSVLISPSSGACGDSAMIVSVTVANNGLNDITSVPVTAEFTGAISAIISTTYTTMIPAGGSATVQVGTVNSYYGGMVDVRAYTGLAGDQDVTNDTLEVVGIEMISAEPLHMPVDTLCAGDTGTFVALPQSGISHNWYQNVNDTVPFHQGDTVAAAAGQTFFLDRNSDQSLVVQTGTSGSHFGTMFKVYVKNDFKFSGYTWVSHLGGTKAIKAFYKHGTYRGHETTRSSWTVIDTVQVPGTTGLTPYRFDFATPITFNAGDTISIYLASKTGKYEAEGLANQGAVIDSVFKTNSDFDYIAGVGGAYFGSNLVTASSPSSIACTLHWESLDVCGNKRIPLTMGINQDTAAADFTYNILNQTVDFDASASSGQVYDWNFGDGNTGSGMITQHTYAQSGTYQVLLTVTDTVCGTIDSLLQSVFINFSLAEEHFENTFKLYPNPSTGIVEVSFDLMVTGKVDLSLVDLLGKTIYREDLDYRSGDFSKTLDLSDLPKGVYLLKIRLNDKTSTRRIVLQ